MADNREISVLIKLGLISKAQGAELEKLANKIKGLEDKTRNLRKEQEKVGEQNLKSAHTLEKNVEREKKAIDKRTKTLKESQAVREKLQKTIETETNKRKKLADEIRTAEKDLKKNIAGQKEAARIGGKALEQNRKQNEKIVGVISKKKDAIDALDKSIEKNTNKSKKALEAETATRIKNTAEVKKASDARRKTEIRVKGQEKELDKLNKEIRENTNELKLNQKEYDKLNSLTSGSKKQIKNLGVTLKGTEKNLTDVAKTIDDTGKEKMATFRKNTEGLREGFKRLGTVGTNQFSAISKTIRRIITTLVTLSTLVLFKNLIKQGAEFENTMIRVAAISRATTDQFKELVFEVRRVAKDTIFTASQVGQVSQVLAQAGFTTGEILTSLQPILELTASTMGEIDQTTELVVAALRAFNLAVEETTRVTNVLAEATISSRANIERLAIAFRFGGPAGAAFNQTIETTTAILARLTDLGLSASIAGTTLRRALIELSKGSARQIKVLQSINVSLEEVNPSFNDLGIILERLSKTTLTAQQAIQLFGARAGSSIFTLIERIREGGETITEFAHQLGTAKELNTVGDLYEKITKSIRSQTLLTKSAFEELGLTIFNVFRPALTKIINSAREAFLQLNEELKKESGKDFAQTLIDLVPLVTALTKALTNALGLIFSVLSTVARLVSQFDWLVRIIEVVVFAYTLMIAKSIVLNKATIYLATSFYRLATVIGAFLLKKVTIFSSGVASLTKVLKLSTIAIGGLTVAIRVLIASLAAASIFFLLPIVIEKIAKLFGFASEETDKLSDSIDNLAIDIDFGTEKMKQLSEQTLIQVSNQEKLNEVIKEGRVAFVDLGKNIEAIKAARITPEDLFPDKTIIPPDESKNILKFIDRLRLLGNQIEKIADRKYFVNPAAFQRFDKGIKSLEDNTNKAATAIKEELNLTAKALGGRVRGEKEAILFSEGLLSGFLKNFGDITKVFKRFTDFLPGQQLKLIDFDAEETDKALSIFADKVGITYESLTKDQRRRLGKFFEFIANKADTLKPKFDSIAKETATVTSKQASEILTRLGSIRQETKELSTELADILRTGGLKVQNKIFTIQGFINKQIDEQIKKIKEANKETKNLNKLKITARGADLQSIVDRIEFNRKIVEARENLLKELQLLQKINVNTEVSRAKQALYNAEQELSIANEKLISQEIKNRNKQLVIAEGTYSDLLERSTDFIGSTKSLGVELKAVQNQLKLNEALDEIEIINERIRVRNDLERKVLDSKKKLQEAEKRQLEFTYRAGELTKARLNDEELVNSLNENAVKIANEENDIAETSKNIEELNKSILEDQVKLFEIINSLNLERLSITQQVADELRDIQYTDEVNAVLKIKDAERERRNELEQMKRLQEDILRNLSQQTGIDIDVDVNKDIKDTIMRIRMLENVIDSISGDDKGAELRKGILGRLLGEKEELNKNLNILKSTKNEIDSINKTEEALTKLVKEQLRIANERLKLKIYEDAEEFLPLSKGITAEILEQKKAEQNLNDQIKQFNNLNSLSHKILGITQDEYNKLLAIQKKNVEEAGRLASAGKFEKVAIGIQDQIEKWAFAKSSVKAYNDVIDEAFGIIKSFASEQIAKQIDKAFGLDPKEEDKTAEEIRKINRKLVDDLLKNQQDYLDKLIQLEYDHRQKLADINSDFDRERRDVERDIFNERVERLTELARLEQELRFQGLTDEQQRAQLLTTIDQNINAARLGTIEQRQIKLAELEEQIKSLNQLENRLGISQSEIDQSSLARLEQLKIETSAFFNDKQRDAVAALENERTAEINAENARYQQQLARLQREKDLADERARTAAATAIQEVKIEAEKDDSIKRLQADLTNAILQGLAKIAVAETINAYKSVAASQSKSTGDAIAAAFKTFGLFAFIAIPAIIGGIAAIFAGVRAIAGKFDGGLIEDHKRRGGELRRIPGGIIQGGHGGIDDIHTALPPNSYIVNRQSTAAHREELSRMVSQARSTRKQMNQVPVAVTAKEFYVPPEIYRNNADRIEQINRDKTGKTSQSIYYGGPVKGFQGGGLLGGSGSSEPSRSIVVNNTIEFSGVNVLSGDSEEAISMIYEQGLRDKIQESMDNREFA